MESWQRLQTQSPVSFSGHAHSVLKPRCPLKKIDIKTCSTLHNDLERQVMVVLKGQFLFEFLSQVKAIQYLDDKDEAVLGLMSIPDLRTFEM